MRRRRLRARDSVLVTRLPRESLRNAQTLDARRLTPLVLAFALGACQKPVPPPTYEAVAVERRDIVVSAQASGTIQPDTTVEVKSKASGEILDLRVETGQRVRRGALMVAIDPRTARNQMAQADADLEVARATLQNAAAQQKRADELFKAALIAEVDHERAQLDYANAKAAVVRAEVAVESAKIQLEDTDVRAPITGTVIEKNVERGQVISSPTRDVGGGTVVLKMADLNLVQVRTLVDETDIGKIQPRLPATVTVDAYPNRTFSGTVLKIEPQAVTQQNVTMFPVLVRIENREGMLRPGMNAEVEIHVGQRDSVLAVPNAALRTARDVGSAAQVLGLTPEEVETQLAANSASQTAPASSTMTASDSPRLKLPDGVTEAQVQAILAKFRNGEEPTPNERAVMLKVRSLNGGNQRHGAAPAGARQGGRFIVFQLSQGLPHAVYIQTGLTDLDYSEVLSGLDLGDSVLILPSASLVQSQQEFKERIGRLTGGGLPGMRQQPQTPTGRP